MYIKNNTLDLFFASLSYQLKQLQVGLCSAKSWFFFKKLGSFEILLV